MVDTFKSLLFASWDEQNNPTAQKIDQLIEQTAVARKDELKAQMSHPQAAQDAKQENTQAPQDYWFMHQNDPSQVPKGMTTVQATTVAPHSEPATNSSQAALSQEDEEALLWALVFWVWVVAVQKLALL